MTEKAIQAALETDDLFTRAVEKAFAAYQAMQPKDAHEDAWVEAACRAFLKEIREPSEGMITAMVEASMDSLARDDAPYLVHAAIDHLLSTSKG